MKNNFLLLYYDDMLPSIRSCCRKIENEANALLSAKALRGACGREIYLT